MPDQFDNLKDLWKRDKLAVASLVPDSDQIIRLAEEKRRKIIVSQGSTMLILLGTLAGIATFFVYVAKFNDTLSHVGSTLMIGSLCVRILIEVYSLFISRNIDFTQSSRNTNDNFLRLYKFRGWVHGPTTGVILVLYTVGFYMLTPEFSRYFSLPMLILIDLSYVVGAIIVGISIRHGIRKEISYLNQVKMLKSELSEDKSKYSVEG
jgi:hypothetical protein